MHHERLIRFIAILATLGILVRAPSAVSWMAGAFLEYPFVCAVETAWLASPFIALLGIFRRRSWGIWCLYGALLLGLVFGSTLIPFWHRVPVMRLQSAGYILLNVAAAAFVARAHLQLRASGKWAAA